MTTTGQHPATCTRGDRNHRRYLAITLAITLATLTMITAAALILLASGGKADHAPAGSEDVPTPVADPQPGTTVEQLHHLTHRLRQQPAAAATPTAGPYTYLHVQVWARDDTIHSRHDLRSVMTRWDIRRWRHDNGPGTSIERRLPDMPFPPDAIQPMDQRTVDAARPVRADYQPGELNPGLPEPASDDPTVLQQQIVATLRPGAEPIDIVNTVPKLFEDGLNSHQRAAVLTLLTQLPGLRYTPAAPDISGRLGIQISLTADTRTVILIINPDPGDILAYQETLTGNHNPGLFTYRLYLTITRATRI